MDIDKIIKTRSDKWRIHFIRNLKHPTWYFIKQQSDIWAFEFIVKSLHLPPYENSAYRPLEVEWIFAIENDEYYFRFLKNEIGVYTPDEDFGIDRWIGDNGWFEFKDISNPDQWLADYHSYQQEIWKSSLPVQQSLF